ncbi:hypothetical protein DPMN_082051 [Dreissena polymorpha]|uniref:PHD-type domain-containing protein n=1 Tax=Dreissena polymorpha TaxID=45954 RepID=A0A9D4B9S2_DREPO|nr:hypothetical protein DPMN_082051 [Dreissena polymorpha]
MANTKKNLTANSANCPCTECQVALDEKKKSIQCDLCDSWFCQKCTNVKNVIFDEIGKASSILWTCKHCNITLPGIKKIIATMSTFQDKLNKIEEKIEKIKSTVPSQLAGQSGNMNDIQEMVHQAMQEECEIEMRKLNVLVQGLPESKKKGFAEGNKDDLEKVCEILNVKLNCNVEVKECIRLGRTFDDRKNSSPIRISVLDFDSKRTVFESARRPRNDPLFAHLYYTGPDYKPKTTRL